MNHDEILLERKKITSNWFKDLRNKITESFENIERDFAEKNSLKLEKDNPKFKIKPWLRNDGNGGGGEISLMYGNVFESVGVNISTVYGKFSPEFAKEIKDSDDGEFWATGISLVAHMKSPLVPAVHMNTRFICTKSQWFGGGADLTPLYPEQIQTDLFHSSFKKACDKHDPTYYPKFKKWCDEYFFLPHRNEARGIGGIFYDYLNSGNFDNDFNFTKDVGLAFLNVYPKIVREKMFLEFTEKDREALLIKRGRYVEFNLLYDRGTRFGFMTGGNTDAILVSMPPVVKWHKECWLNENENQ
jgi:coproporphyrinogen III oxidase